MSSVRRSAAIPLVAALTGACAGGSSEPSSVTAPPPPPAASADTIPLRVLAAARGLQIGSAVDRGFRYSGNDGVQFRRVLAREFNVLTPENDLKHQRIHPTQTAYRFEPADSLVAFAEANGMRVRGHTLVWHQQLANWLTSGSWTPTQARTLLQEHISSVVAHYRGRVFAWDVVNEALADDGSMRPGFWLDRVGREYIEVAFRAANSADPSALLFYNDYNIEGMNAKSDSAYALVRDLLARGVPIHGVGLQGHFQVGGVPNSLAANIARFAALGVKLHITELDVRVQLPATPAQLQTQAQNYRDVVLACMQNSACNTVVLWGFTDRESWVPGTFQGWGDALIFDSAYQPKPAFLALYNLLK